MNSNKHEFRTETYLRDSTTYGDSFYISLHTRSLLSHNASVQPDDIENSTTGEIQQLKTYQITSTLCRQSQTATA